MFQKVTDRLKEPSSYAGLAAILYGAGQIFKDDNLPVVADAVNSAGQTMAASGSTSAAIGALVMGVLALFVGEKKK